MAPGSGRHKYWEVTGPVTSRRDSEAERAFSDGRDRHVFGGETHGPITESNAKRIFGIETCRSISAFKKVKPRTRVLVINLPTSTEKERYTFLRRVLEKRPDVHAFFGDVVNLNNIVVRARADKFESLRDIIAQTASEEGVSEQQVVIEEKDLGDAPKPTTVPYYFDIGSFYPYAEEDEDDGSGGATVAKAALRGIPVCGFCEADDDGRVFFRLSDRAMRRFGRRLVDGLVKRGTLKHRCEMVVMNNSQVKSYASKRPQRTFKGVHARRLFLRRPNNRKAFVKIPKKVVSRWTINEPEYTSGGRFDHIVRNGLAYCAQEGTYTVGLPFRGDDANKVQGYLGITSARSIRPHQRAKRRKMFMLSFDFDTPMGDKVKYIIGILRLNPQIRVDFTDPVGVNEVTFTLPRQEAEALVEEMETFLCKRNAAAVGHDKPELVACNDVIEKNTLDGRKRKCAVVALYLENIGLASLAVPSHAYCFATTSSNRLFFRVPEGVSFQRTQRDLVNRSVVGFEGLVYNISVKECNDIVRSEGLLSYKDLDLLLARRRPKRLRK